MSHCSILEDVELITIEYVYYVHMYMLTMDPLIVQMCVEVNNIGLIRLDAINQSSNKKKFSSNVVPVVFLFSSVLTSDVYWSSGKVSDRVLK